MKIIVFKRVATAVAVTVIFLFSFTSCKKYKKNTVDPTRRTTIQLSGSQEVPANNSTGTGTGQIAFNPTSKTITYSVTWQLGSPDATTDNMHFHGADNGSDATSSAVVIGITGFTTASSGTFSSVTRALTDTEVNQLLAGKWYLNIHSSTIPAGELRGNIKFGQVVVGY